MTKLYEVDVEYDTARAAMLECLASLERERDEARRERDNPDYTTEDYHRLHRAHCATEDARRKAVEERDALAREPNNGHAIPPEALSWLRNHQRQLDMDGVEVGVSRQALDELLNAFASAHEAGALDMRERAARIAEAFEQENLAMCSDSIMNDPVLTAARRQALKSLPDSAWAESKKHRLDGVIGSAQAMAARNIATAISALDPKGDRP